MKVNTLQNKKVNTLQKCLSMHSDKVVGISSSVHVKPGSLLTYD